MNQSAALTGWPKTIVLATAVAMLSAGCVSQSKYDQLAQQNSELQQQNTVLTIQQRELFVVTGILSREVELLDEEIAMLETERAELEIELETLLLAGNIKMELLKSGLVLTLEEDVLFSSGSTTIKPGGRQAISDVVQELEQVPYQIIVIGHTDNVPIGAAMKERFPSNWALAATRASAVVSLMADEGIPKRQLVAVSFGDTHPVASNNTEQGRAANRRIEIRLRPVINALENEN
jgi:chemotaxis protein MotB